MVDLSLNVAFDGIELLEGDSGVSGRESSLCAQAAFVVVDGTSNTVAVAEWNRGGPGTITANTYSHYGIGGLNAQDDSGRCNGSFGMPFNFQPIPGTTVTAQQNRTCFASYHTGGVNAVMCDGSVSFFSNNIDYFVQRSLGTRNGNEPAPVF